MVFCDGMKRIYILITLGILLPVCIFAQQSEDVDVKPQRSPQEIAEQQTTMLQRDLNLTDEQTILVYEMNLKYALKGRPQNQMQADERLKQKLSDLKAILNEQQYNQFVKKMSEVRHIRGGMKLTPMPVTSDSMQRKR